jgi:hypothetical protein
MRILAEKTIAPARRPGIEVECLIQETRADTSVRTNREREQLRVKKLLEGWVSLSLGIIIAATGLLTDRLLRERVWHRC